MTADSRTPVLVGVGVVVQHSNDPLAALEPFELMAQALERATQDSGSHRLLTEADSILVPQGFWQYSDPGRLVADRIGAARARTGLARVGILQQSLISEACRAIAAGKEKIALVTGGEAKYRSQLARHLGLELRDRHQTDVEPDITLASDDDIWAEIESDSGLFMPVQFFALIENAMRFHNGLDLDTHRDQIAGLWERFSAVAADNPHAWNRSRVPAEKIRNPAPNNHMLAFPYTKRHSSQWNVDQAAGLILCSLETARAHKVPEDRWVFPLSATESNHVVPVSARAQIHRCPGIAIAGGRALELAGQTASAVTHLDLYSCFPAPVQLFARELGFGLDRPLTVTGGMAFAGGPLNNYVLQATARMAEVLRSDPGSTGLVTSISGFLNKHGYAVWSTQPPAEGFHFADLSSQVASTTEQRRLVPHYEGPASVATYTVIYAGEEPEKGVAICELPEGARTVASTDDPALCATMTAEEFCGRKVRIGSGRRLFATEELA